MLLSDVCMSVAYVGPNSRTERPRKTKIGIEVAHVTRDSDTTFTIKRSKVNLQGGGRGILWRPPAQLVTIIIIMKFDCTEQQGQAHSQHHRLRVPVASPRVPQPDVDVA